MVRRQRQIGVVVTLLVAAAWMLGLLDRAEMPTQDWRARWFGFFSPASSDDVVIVGIDDQALRTIQSWPWDRIHLADAIKEISLAGARVTALDVLLEEPQDPRPDSWTHTADIVDGDAALSQVLRHWPSRSPEGERRRSTSYVVACRFGNTKRTDDPKADAKRPDPEILKQMARKEVLRLLATGELDDAIAADPSLIVWAAERLEYERERLPEGDESVLMYRAIINTAAVLRCEKSSAQSWQRVGASIPRAPYPVPPVLAHRMPLTLGDVSGDSLDGDWRLRRASLWVKSLDAVWPALAPQTVGRFLLPGNECNVDIFETSPRQRSSKTKQSSGPQTVVLAASNSEPVSYLPMTRGVVSGRTVDTLCYITWPKATSHWQGQFESNPNGTPHEISIGYVLEPKLLARSIRNNWIELGKLIEVAKGYGFAEVSLFTEPPGRELDWLDSPTVPEWLQEKDKHAHRASDAAKEFLELSAGTDPATLKPEDATLLANYKAIAAGIPQLLDEIHQGIKQRQEVRANLKQILGGKLVFVGWTATGITADTVPTSINPRTPGVYVHAAVANSMLTGFARQFFPFWVDVLFICVLGALGTLTAIRAAVWASPLLAMLLIVVWFLIAGIGLWDAAWRIASVTGPSLAVAGSWLAVTLHRLLVEQRARRRTEEQFRSYVSPEVVDILVDNPRLGSVAPQRRELTVMMADLAGFTALAERLGEEAIAGVLGTYLGEMTRVLLRHGATIDKYLGDGIMAFWGAPLGDPDHARHACSAALDMLATLDRLNAKHAFGEAGTLRLRIGLAAGQLMVGDFGCPPYRSSYTVLGDIANVCERLEGANKLLGTSLLVSSRVRELASGKNAAGQESGSGKGNGEERAPSVSERGLRTEQRIPLPNGRGSLSPNHAFASGFLWRSIGRVRLRGRLVAEEVFELIGEHGRGGQGPASLPPPFSNASSQASSSPTPLTNQEQNAKSDPSTVSAPESMNPPAFDPRMENRLTLTGQGVREYIAGDFESARLTFGRLTTAYGDDPLCCRYLLSIADWQSRISGPITLDSLLHAGFDGTIDLTDA